MEKRKVSFEELLGVESKTLKVAIERLRPPPEPIISSDIDLDFNAIANASEFRRFVYWIRTGKVFRGSNEKLDIELKKTQEDLDIVKLMKKQQRPIFMGVMNEYKDKLVKLKERGR